MADSPPSSAAAKPRRQRRWLRRVCWGFLLALVLLWLVRVPLANWALHRLPGDWDISITGLHPGFSGARLEGVRVVHRPTGRLFVLAEEAVATNGWGGLLKGALGSLALNKAEVTWREEFETPYVLPVEGNPPAQPLVTWNMGKVTDSVFTWYEAGRELPRLSLKIVSLDGGRFIVYEDGRVEAAEQNLVLADVVSREDAMAGEMEIETRSALVSGVVTAQQALNRYTVEQVNLKAPSCHLVWHRREAPSAPATAESGPSRPAWDKPIEFVIRKGTAEPGAVSFAVQHPGAAAPIEFAAALSKLEAGEMRIAGGLPFVLGPTNAKLEQLKSPGTTLEAREITLTAALNEQHDFLVSAATVNGANITDSSRLLPALGFTPEQIKAFPVCRGGLDAKCSRLLINGEGVTSPEAQQVTLQDFSAVMPGEKEPIFKAVRTELSALPAEVLQGKHLRSVVVEKAEVRITENAFTDELNPVAPPPAPAPAPAAPPEKPTWYGWHTDSLTVRTGRVRGVDLGPGIPDAEGDFTVATSPREPGGDPFYHIHVAGISLSNPVLAILTKIEGVMDIDVHPVKVYETESVDEVRINGMKVELNEALMKLFQSDAPKPPVAPPAPDAPKPTAAAGRPWKINRVLFENCEIAIDDVGDGRRLVIPIRSQEFKNVPLGTALADHDSANTIQKVEVPAIYLYAPFNEGMTVAELPVNFIHFTFAGLMEKRLERVELIAPKIKAGAPLFDFIDTAEKRWTKPPLTPIGEPVAVPAPGVRKPGWDISFYTEFGSVITAPNGLEWTDIPRLPFRNARVREGPDKGKPIPFRLHGDEAHGELAIEPGWREFPEHQLRIYMSDEGRVVFNFPLKEKDNNLVEVFKNNTVIYKQLEIAKVWLSVTYDKAGIYIGFGGETCGGYITGKMNLYLDQVYSWDASASFTGINLKTLTSKLTKENVLIEGVVDVLNMTAYGDMTGLYQTTASLTMSRPGRLYMRCLDGLRARFVDARVNWKDDFGRIGVDALRDFAFTSCHGSAKLFGEEGTVKLLLKSPHGSRDFTVNLKDYRHHPAKAVVRF